MNKLYILGLLGLLLFGCVDQPNPPTGGVSQTCEEYCKDQPHTQCVGEWQISGDYPDCECGWVCDQEDDQSGLANPAAVNCEDNGYDYEIRETEEGSTGYCSYQGNECEEWALYRVECCLQDSDCVNADCAGADVSCVSSECVCTYPEEPSDGPIETDKTIEELVNERLEELKTLYLSQTEGSTTIDIKTYKWFYSGIEDPTSIPIGNTGITKDLLFDDKEIKSLRAFGVRIFNDEYSGKEDVYGILLFSSDPVDLNRFYEQGSQFDIYYRPVSPDKKFRDCIVDDKLTYENGDTWTVYYFNCEWVESIEDV